MKNKQVIAVDITESIRDNANGIPNVVKQVHKALSSSLEWELLPVYFHKHGKKYYIHKDGQVANNDLKVNLRFVLYIIRFLISRRKSQYKKMVHCYSFLKTYPIWNLSGKLFRFCVTISQYKNTNEPTIINKINDKISIKNLKTLDFGKIDIFVLPGCKSSNELDILALHKKQHRFQFLSFVYDIIPVRHPEYCDVTFAKRITKCINQTLQYANYIVTVSKHVKKDLENFIDETGIAFNKQNIIPVQLGTDDCGEENNIDQSVFQKYNITPNKYAVIISTINPRKNHQLLYNVWKRIVSNNPNNVIPLIMMGGYGWNCEKIVNTIQNDDATKNLMIFAGQVDDATRNQLLQNARFSVFPSFVEGWGMPITESLQYHVPAISADNSSLPEAGHGICEMISANDVERWYQTVLKYMTDDEIIAQKRQEIAATKLRSWNDFASDIKGIIANIK